MNLSSKLLIAAGTLAVIIGIVWIGQGLGYFRYPARSFMIDQSRWAWWGLALAAAGLVSIALASYRR